jgi:hypothetical protein
LSPPKKNSRRDTDRAKLTNDDVTAAAGGEPGADEAWAKIEALCRQLGDVLETYWGLKGGAKRVETTVKFALNARPRMAARDAEVARLREQERMDWTGVWHRIRRNPAWAQGRDGQPVTKKMLQVAYRRRKKVGRG